MPPRIQSNVIQTTFRYLVVIFNCFLRLDLITDYRRHGVNIDDNGISLIWRSTLLQREINVNDVDSIPVFYIAVLFVGTQQIRNIEPMLALG